MDIIENYLAQSATFPAFNFPAFILPVASAIQSEGMTTDEIKAHLILHAGSISAAADAIGEKLKDVSHTINYEKPNYRIRELLSKRYGVRFSDKITVRCNERRKAA